MRKEIRVQDSSVRSAHELVDRLSGIPGFRKKQITDTHAVVSVGHEWLMRLIGVYFYDNYTAPVKIAVEKSEHWFNVTMSPPNLMFILGERTENFFSRTYAKIEECLSCNT